LWPNLSHVANLHNLPWLLLRDSNEILNGNDELGGRQVYLSTALDFKACLDKCNFLDLGFLGPKYTWSNLRQVTDHILERIDRCFANPTWRVLFPKAFVTHLPRVFSNYYPVLLELFRSPLATYEKPFRFHTMWIRHPKFPDVVKKAWESNINLHSAIRNFTDRAKQWNRSVFGNLFARKKKVLARLNGAQKALSNGPNNFLIQLERSLIEEYNSIMQQEEYWALKSRLNWVAYGDCNTSFFFMSLLC